MQAIEGKLKLRWPKKFHFTPQAKNALVLLGEAKDANYLFNQ